MSLTQLIKGNKGILRRNDTHEKVRPRKMRKSATITLETIVKERAFGEWQIRSRTPAYEPRREIHLQAPPGANAYTVSRKRQKVQAEQAGGCDCRYNSWQGRRVEIIYQIADYYRIR